MDCNVLPLSMLPRDVFQDSVLSFVGPGHYLFVSLVCKDWRHCYQTRFAKRTSLNAAAESVSRTNMALDDTAC